jgi:hypothetical protein
MNKTLQLSVFALFAGAFMLLSGCGKDVTVDYTIADHEKCVAASPYTGGVVDSFTILQADLRAAFDAAKTTFATNRINSMVAKGFKIKGSGSSTLDGITGAAVYIKTQGTSGDGTQIASTSSSPSAGINEVELAINGTDIKEMLGERDLVVTLKLWYDNTQAKCVTLTKGTMTFNVKK